MTQVWRPYLFTLLGACVAAVSSTACVAAFNVAARRPVLEVEPFDTLLTGQTMQEGQLLVAVAASRGTPGLLARIELVVDDVVVDSLSTRSQMRQILRWTPPVEAGVQHRLVVRGFDEQSAPLAGGAAYSVTVSSLPPSVEAFSAAPTTAVADALDVSFTLSATPAIPVASIALLVGDITQSVPLANRTVRVAGLTAGQVYPITLRVTDNLGNVSVLTERAGPSVWFIAPTNAPSPGGAPSGSLSRPFRTLASVRATTSGLARVWYQLLPGDFLGSGEPSGSEEVLPLLLEPGRTLRGTLSSSGEILSHIIGRGALPPLVVGVAGCAAVYAVGGNDLALPIGVEAVSIAGGTATGPCPAPPEGLISASAHLAMKKVSLRGLQTAVRMVGLAFATRPVLEDVTVRTSVIGLSATENVWPRIVRYDYENPNTELARALFLRADMPGDIFSERYTTVSASRMVLSTTAIEVTGSQLLYLSAKSGARNFISLTGADATAFTRTGLNVGDVSVVSVCGSDFEIAANVTAGVGAHLLSALRSTTTQKLWVGGAPVGSPAECEPDPLVTITTNGFGDGIGIFSSGNEAGFDVNHLRAVDRSAALSPAPAPADRSAGIYINDLYPATNSAVRNSSIRDFGANLWVNGSGGVSPYLRVLSSCLTPLPTARAANTDWVVQVISDPTGFVTPRVVRAGSFNDPDSSRDADRVNFAIYSDGDIVVEPGDANCP